MNDTREFKCLPDRALVAALRASVRDALEAWKVAEQPAGRIVLVVDEIVNNSIDHGEDYRVPSHELGLRISVDGSDVELMFSDPDVPEPIARALGTQLATGSDSPPPLDDERGRGLFLIMRMLDEVLFDWSPDLGMTITGRVRGIAG